MKRLMAAALVVSFGGSWAWIKLTRDFGQGEGVLTAVWESEPERGILRVESPFPGILEVLSRPGINNSTPVPDLRGRVRDPVAGPGKVHRADLRRLEELGVMGTDLVVLAPGGEIWPVSLEGALLQRIEPALRWLSADVSDVTTGPVPGEMDARCCRVYLRGVHRDARVQERCMALARAARRRAGGPDPARFLPEEWLRFVGGEAPPASPPR